MIFFSGFAVGTFVAGIVSDIWGRKRSILLFSFLMLASGLATSFMPVFPSFVVMWWLVGVAAVANFTVAFVWTIELAAGSGRETLFSKLYIASQANGKLFLECQCSSHGLLVEVWPFWLLGSIQTGEQSFRYHLLYFLTSNMWLQFVSAPCAIAPILIYFLPESPRWLIAKGRISEARSED